MLKENTGLRGLAIRAGLLHPNHPPLLPLSLGSPPSLASLLRLLSPRHASLSPPLTIPSFPDPQLQKKQGKSPFSLFSEASPLPSGFHLSGTHSLGFGTVVETQLHGSKVHLDELSMRISKMVFSPIFPEERNPCETLKLSMGIMTDLHQRNRVTLEQMIGTKEDKHTVSCALSSDFQSQLALGVASSHRLSKAWSLFARYSKDGYAGKRIFLQAVHELDQENKVSAACTTFGQRNCQAGLSWIHERERGQTRSKISLKGLCSMDGTFSVSIKAEVGSME